MKKHWSKSSFYSYSTSELPYPPPPLRNWFPWVKLVTELPGDCMTVPVSLSIRVQSLKSNFCESWRVTGQISNRREGILIWLFITLVPKVLSCFLIHWLDNFMDFNGIWLVGSLSLVSKQIVCIIIGEVNQFVGHCQINLDTGY